MKVAHVIVGGEVSGGQIVCQSIVEALQARGDGVIVISPTPGAFADRMQAQGIPVFFIPFAKSYHMQNAFSFAALLRREKIDLVHTHAMVTANIPARLGAFWAGVPVISHIHIPNYFSKGPLIRLYQKAFDTITSAFCARLIAVSESVRRALLCQGISQKQITLIYNGICPDKTIPQRTRADVFHEFGLTPSTKLIGTVGRLCPVKGQQEFILAAKRVLSRFPQARFFIVGKDLETGGRYEQYLRELTRAEGIDASCVFTGYRSDVLDLVNAFDFFVLPSYTEGLPITILEAMALKKAVIATRVGGVPEIVVDQETGLCIKPGDISGLEEAMAYLLTHEEKAGEMGRRGHERIQRYFLEEKMLNEVLALYDQIINKTRGLA
ncbi:MAG: glycosyltransferase family 4 protein [Candidatus Omnitrophica bacterium]|nr:glycosyltransferase family 4 protein [Candidatus Omnitrophota bacterium]